MGDRARLVALAALCGLTWVLHWRGITLVGAGVLVLMLRRQFWDTVLFGVIASLPSGTALLINRVMTGTFTGHRPPPFYEFRRLISDFTAILVDMVAWYAAIMAFSGLVFLLLRRIAHR